MTKQAQNAHPPPAAAQAATQTPPAPRASNTPADASPTWRDRLADLWAGARLFKEPGSAWSHFLAFWAALVGAVALLVMTVDDPIKRVGMGIYGAAMVTLFLASSCYHFFDLGWKLNRWLRRFDHAAIFLMIGGTYVPPMLHYLDGTFRVVMLSVVGGLALAGIIFKVAWIDCPDWLGALVYVLMSAAVIVPSYEILTQLAPGPLALLLAGGAAYLIGVLVFVFQWPDPWPPNFGHHEVWHVFVILGAGAHYTFTLHMID